MVYRLFLMLLLATAVPALAQDVAVDTPAADAAEVVETAAEDAVETATEEATAAEAKEPEAPAAEAETAETEAVTEEVAADSEAETVAEEAVVEETATDGEASHDEGDAHEHAEHEEHPVVEHAAPVEHADHPDVEHAEHVEHADVEHAEHDHAAAHGGGKAAAPNPLTADPDLALWTLGVFGAMLLILKTIAWTPIMEGLKAREEGISGNIAAADAKHEEAKALLSEHQAKLAGTADEVRELLEEARRDAEQTKTDILAEASSLADSVRERAVRDIDQARDSAVRQLAESTAGLAIDLAAKVVRQDISSARQSEIVKEALGRFGNDPSAN